MAYSSFPRIVNPDYSPPQDVMSYQEPFDKNYLSDGYTTNPDYSLSTFFDTESFYDPPLTTTEQVPSQGYTAGPTQDAFNPTLPATGIAATNSQIYTPQQQLPYPAPFGQLRQFPTAFPLETTALNTIEPSTFSPDTYTTSRTPSLCGDTQPNVTSPMFPTQRLIKCESPSSPTSPTQTNATTTTTSPRPQRKRGRPRLDRHHQSSSKDSPTSTSSSAAKHQKTSTSSTTARLPHNQVERKYREGLNSELERLRRAVPTLPQADEGMGQPKPSKAMVLGAAIEYIRRIEMERDELRGEVEKLRGGKTARQDEVGDEGGEWDGELDEFLRDV